MSEYDARVEEVAETLLRYVGRGLKPDELAKHLCFRQLPRAIARTPERASWKRQCQAIHGVLLDALRELEGNDQEEPRGTYRVLVGRRVKQTVSAKQVRQAIRVLLDDGSAWSNESGGERRRIARVEILKLGCGDETFRREGPMLDLMRILARQMSIVPKQAIWSRVDAEWALDRAARQCGWDMSADDRIACLRMMKDAVSASPTEGRVSLREICILASHAVNRRKKQSYDAGRTKRMDRKTIARLACPTGQSRWRQFLYWAAVGVFPDLDPKKVVENPRPLQLHCEDAMRRFDMTFGGRPDVQALRRLGFRFIVDTGEK